jgi:hypothetical protein
VNQPAPLVALTPRPLSRGNGGSGYRLRRDLGASDNDYMRVQLCSIIERACLGPEVSLRRSNPASSTALSRGGQHAAHFLVDSWSAVSGHRGRRHSGKRSGRATMWTRGDVELHACRGGSPRAQPLRFDAFEPSSAGGAFRRSRHVYPLASADHAGHPHLQINWLALPWRYGPPRTFVWLPVDTSFQISGGPVPAAHHCFRPKSPNNERSGASSQARSSSNRLRSRSRSMWRSGSGGLERAPTRDDDESAVSGVTLTAMRRRSARTADPTTEVRKR